MQCAAKGVPGVRYPDLALGSRLSISIQAARKGYGANSARKQMAAELLEDQRTGRELNARPRNKRSRVLQATANKGDILSLIYSH